MPVPQITALPDPPSRQDPTNFAVKGDAFLGALPNFANEANELAEEVNGAVDAAFAAGLASVPANTAAVAASALAAKTSELLAAGYANAAAQITTGFDTLRPKVRPTLNLDFVNQEIVDRRVVVSRSSPKSYFGKRKVLIEENLFRWSEGFDNALWVKTNGAITANSTVAPNGLLTADTFTASSANATCLQSISLNGTLYTTSFWIQRITGTGDVQLTIDGTTFVTVAVTGTWTRFNISQTPAAGSRNVGLRLVTSGDAVAIWGGQLENRSMTAYVQTVDFPVRLANNALETAAANVMPVEYDPINQRCFGIRPERSNTNLLLRSEEFDNASWSKNAGVIESNVAIAPNGTLTADKFIINNGQVSTGAGSGVGSVTQNVTVVSGAPYIYSFYVKPAGVTNLFLRLSNGTGVSFDLATGTVLTGAGQANFTPFITNVGGGWYRVWAIIIVTGTTLTINIKSGTTGDGYSGFLLWGAQLEASTLGRPSSYIPTTSAQVTRLSDDLTMPVTEFDYNRSEGSLILEVSTDVASGAGFQVAAEFGDGGANNRINYRRTNEGAGNVVITNFGAAQVNIFDLALPVNVDIRIGSSFKINSASYYKDGVLVGTDASAIVPVIINTLYIGSQYNGLQWEGYIRSLRYYNQALSAAELQALSKV